MLHGRRSAVVWLTSAGLCAARAQPAAADAKPLRLIVPQPPGGASDAIARLVAAEMTASSGRTVVIENRPGAGTILGTIAVAHALPDGNTVGLVVSAHAINQALRAKMPFDALADFAPVCLGGHAVMALVANSGFPARTVQELIRLAKRSLQPLAFASLGVGTASHLAGRLFALSADIALEHLPYNGSAQIYRAMRGDEVPLAVVTLESALPHLRAGRIDVLGVTTARRTPAFPMIPTIAETLDGYEVLSFFGFVAPKRTPDAIVERLYRDIASALSQPTLSRRLTERAIVVELAAPRVFEAFLRDQIRRYAEIGRLSGIRIES
jgi:tripartite-type tricarboxylate transporter receptor subunit TctC